mgnify:CR=1 FL=1
MSVAMRDLGAELEDLAGRIRAGDRRAEADLMSRYQASARAIARRHCRPNEPQVDDIVNDVLSDLLNRLRRGQIEDPRALPQYLQLSIRNACTAWYRRESKLQSDDFLTVASTQPDTDPAESAVSLQRERMVRTLLRELPMPRDRELLRRFYLLEETRDDVCAALKIEIDHFRRVVHRARQRMRMLLDRSGIEEI